MFETFKNLPIWKKLFAAFVTALAVVPIAAYVLQPPLRSVPRLEELWRVDLLDNPESAVYDPIQRVIYVSNINGEPLVKDNNGYIARVSRDGKLLEPLVTGLNGPKGIDMLRNELFVADIDRLVVIDIENEQITKTVPVADSGFLNDLLVVQRAGLDFDRRYGLSGGEGLTDINLDARRWWGRLVLMSDTFKDRIYGWVVGSDTEVKVVAEGPPFVAPNGLAYVAESYRRENGNRGGSLSRLLTANWGTKTEGFAISTSTPGAIWQLPDLARGNRPEQTETRKRLTEGEGSRIIGEKATRLTEPFGNLDGIVSYRGGNYIVTDWVAGKIYHVNYNGQITELAAPGKGSADLGLDLKRGIIYVPMMLDNQLIAYKIKERYYR